MLANYTFNQHYHPATAFDKGLPNLTLLGKEEVMPGQFAPIMLMEYNRIRLRYFRWGLIPEWSKDNSMGQNRLMAPARNVFQRPSFQKAIRSQRCLIPADAFALQQGLLLNGSRYNLNMPDNDLFCFAGIYDRWEGPTDSGSRALPSSQVDAPTHLRTIARQIPLVLPRHQEKMWLNTDTNLNTVARLMQPSGMPKMHMEALAPLATSPKQSPAAA